MALHSVVLVLVHQRMILEKNFRLGKSACITLPPAEAYSRVTFRRFTLNTVTAVIIRGALHVRTPNGVTVGEGHKSSRGNKKLGEHFLRLVETVENVETVDETELEVF